MSQSTMLANVTVAERHELTSHWNETPLPADAEHPSWCNPRQCYFNPETGFPVHEYAPMPVTVNGETIALTVVRWDTAEGAGETWTYLATTSEEGDVITKRKWAD